MVINGLRCADLFNTPVPHDCQPVCEAEGFLLIVRDKHRAHPRVLQEGSDLLARGMTHTGIKVRKWFVQQNELRPRSN